MEVCGIIVAAINPGKPFVPCYSQEHLRFCPIGEDTEIRCQVHLSVKPICWCTFLAWIFPSVVTVLELSSPDYIGSIEEVVELKPFLAKE